GVPRRVSYASMKSNMGRRAVRANIGAVYLAAAVVALSGFAGCGPAGAGGDRFDRACVARCALPPGLDLARLAPEEREYVLARALLCGDYECGRLGRSEYLRRLAELRYVGLGLAAADARTAAR